MGAGITFPSPCLRGEGGAAVAAEGEGTTLPSPSPSLGFPSHFPLPLKEVRGFGVAPQRYKDCAQDPIEVGHHVSVGESDDTIAALFQRSRASGVVRFASRVRVSVELDDEAFATAGEVGDVGREDDLALELHADTVGPEVVPETALGFGEIRAQLLGAIPCFDVPFQSAPSPRSASQSRPLPLKGARGLDRHASTSRHGSFAVNA